MTKLFEGAKKEKTYVVKSIVLGFLFWLLNYTYQLYFISTGDYVTALIRSSAFVSATLIAIALLIGPLAKIFPSKNYIPHRRTIGVIGFTFGIVHYLSILIFVFQLDNSFIFSNLNPYANPLIFGFIAFLLYIPIYLTSTDWALQKLTFRRWKAIHRIVYIAWIFTVLHFLQINPAMLLTLPGYLLLIATACVFIFELSAFIKHTLEKGGSGKYIGIAVFLFGLALFYLAYAINKNIFAAALIGTTLAGMLIITIYLRTKKRPKPPEFQQQSA